jgi:hypothetical protein
MALYGLIKIKLDAHGRIERAGIREVDSEHNRWIGAPMEMPANQIARMIGTGHVFQSVFKPNPQHPYPRTGARLRMKTFAGHGFGVELEKETEGNTVFDLAKLD